MKSVEIELDGKVRKLKYSYEVIADMEEAMGGVSVLALLQQDKFGFHTARMFVMYGLRHEEKGMTKQRAGKMLGQYLEDGGDFGGVLDIITRAVAASGVFGKEALEALGNPEGAAE